MLLKFLVMVATIFNLPPKYIPLGPTSILDVPTWTSFDMTSNEISLELIARKL